MPKLLIYRGIDNVYNEVIQQLKRTCEVIRYYAINIIKKILINNTIFFWLIVFFTYLCIPKRKERWQSGRLRRS